MRQIMAKKSVDLPILGAKNSTNWLLGTNGFIGGKTGNTDQAGGVFVGIAEKEISKGKNTIIVTAVQGSGTVNQAMSETDDFLTFISPLFKEETLVEKGQKIGTIKTVWGETTDIVAEKTLKSIIWNGSKVELNFKTNINPTILTKDSQVGFVEYRDHQVALIAKSDISTPSWQWKLAHIWQ
jgi:D-alanyl-D-alanine carboxypeptidase (penicillin-binding protein 5/6)